MKVKAKQSNNTFADVDYFSDSLVHFMLIFLKHSGVTLAPHEVEELKLADKVLAKAEKVRQTLQIKVRHNRVSIIGWKYG